MTNMNDEYDGEHESVVRRALEDIETRPMAERADGYGELVGWLRGALERPVPAPGGGEPAAVEMTNAVAGSDDHAG